MKILIYRAFNETDCYIGTSGQSIQKIIGLIKEFSKRDNINWAPARYIKEYGLDSLKFEVVCESNRREMDNDLYTVYKKYEPNMNINDRFA